MLGERHLVHLKKIQAMQSKINSLQIKYELLHRKKRKEKKIQIHWINLSIFNWVQQVYKYYGIILAEIQLLILKPKRWKWNIFTLLFVFCCNLILINGRDIQWNHIFMQTHRDFPTWVSCHFSKSFDGCHTFVGLLVKGTLWSLSVKVHSTRLSKFIFALRPIKLFHKITFS